MKLTQVKQAGFTLIELIVVIVILGILAATALPKFVNLSSDAANSAVEGVAGALSSASGINFGAKQVGKALSPTTISGVAAQTAAGYLLQGGLPTGYSVTGTACGGSAETTDWSVGNGKETTSGTARIICY